MGKALVLKGTNFSVNKVDTVTLEERIPCTGITLNKNTLSFNSLSDTETLTASVTPADTTDIVAWSTSDANVATVSEGTVTAVGEGTATITATCGTYSATCAVTIELPLDFVFVAGYKPTKSTSSATWCSLNKSTSSSTTSNLFILAANNSNTNVHPVTYDETADTSPYRFVPIKIPSGATAIRLTMTNSNYALRTMTQFFDSTQTDGYQHYGAKLVNGTTETDGWNQSEVLNSQTISIPTVSGLDSFAFAVGVDALLGTKFEDYKDQITVEFIME